MIEVKNVTKRYGKFYAVRNISFEVKDGEIVGFLGRNGAGKTTTMNMITGFIEPTEGDILVGGVDIDANPNKVKAQIGYMPEGTPLYNELTVKEFVNYMAELRKVPKKERKEAVEKAIKATGLDLVKNNLTKNLSRGYRQRVSLAGTIVGEPKLLILDEPTVGLDPKQVVEIRELIKSFARNHTVFISSHILSEISQICDRVIIIDKGEIVAVDTPANLERQTKMQDPEKTLIITVDDADNKFEDLLKNIKGVKGFELIEKVEDSNSKKYNITVDTKNDARKEIFSACANAEVLILEMKEEEKSLEDAFINLVQDRKEQSQKEIEKQEYAREIEELREEIAEKKQEKENRKQAIKEEKARKKAQKEAKKNSKEGGNE